MPRRALAGLAQSVLTVLLVALAACGNQAPTAPPVVGPPAPAVEWAALARLFDDPLFKDLPLLLRDQEAARPLNTAVSKLVAGISARNLDVVKDALLEVASAREAYAGRPSFQPCDRAILVTLSLFELRGAAYVSGSSASGAEIFSLVLVKGR